MKSFPFLTYCLGSLLTAYAANPQTLISFDDLSLQNYGGPIPNGYAGLEWDNFGVLDPQRFPGDSVGNLNGMVSPRHIAFPAWANSDGTTTGGFHMAGSLFDLHSAYLTAAWNDGLHMEVQGFVGGALAYDTSLTLNTTGPILANFSFLGIDEVRFTSWGGIPHGNPGGGGTGAVIDNLVITVPEPGPVGLLLGGGCIVAYWLRRRKPGVQVMFGERGHIRGKRRSFAGRPASGG